MNCRHFESLILCCAKLARIKSIYFAGTFCQGQKHHGYHVLYENLKHEEESVQELAQFVKDRATYEEEWNKFLNKCITKVLYFLRFLTYFTSLVFSKTHYALFTFIFASHCLLVLSQRMIFKASFLENLFGKILKL